MADPVCLSPVWFVGVPLSVHVLGVVPIPRWFMSKAEAVTVVGCLQPRSTLNEQDRVLAEMLLAAFYRNLSASA